MDTEVDENYSQPKWIILNSGQNSNSSNQSWNTNDMSVGTETLNPANGSILSGMGQQSVQLGGGDTPEVIIQS